MSKLETVKSFCTLVLISQAILYRLSRLNLYVFENAFIYKTAPGNTDKTENQL